MVFSQFFSSIKCACLVSGVKHRGGNHQVAPSERGYFFGAQGFLLERMGFALSLRRTAWGVQDIDLGHFGLAKRQSSTTAPASNRPNASPQSEKNKILVRKPRSAY